MTTKFQNLIVMEFLKRNSVLAQFSVNRERKISPKFFGPKFFRGRPRGMSVPKCFVFQDLEGLTEVFGRMSAGISAPKLPLWADFLFLSKMSPPQPPPKRKFY